jgi:hypothetical protein
MMQSTSYSSSPTKIEVSVIRVTPPWSAVSTSVTDGSLKASRYVSLNVGRLHMYRYQGLSASAATGSFTTEATRARISFIFWKSASS